MADASEINTTQGVKIAGADSDFNETYAVGATPKGDLTTSDGLHSGGTQGNVNLVTANTAYEAKVGASRLSGRKSLTIMPIDADMYWGYTNSVSTSTGTPIFKNQFKEFSLDPNDSSTAIWLVCGSANKNARITESD